MAIFTLYTFIINLIRRTYQCISTTFTNVVVHVLVNVVVLAW